MVVTGATGIGAATARRAAADGASVFVMSLQEREVAALCDEIVEQGGVADGVGVDLTQERAAEEAFDTCVARVGVPDGVVAVAGGSGRRHGDGPVGDVPLSGWDATVTMNMTPMFLTVRGAVRAMTAPTSTGASGGSIVVISSVLARHPSPLFVTHAYAAAKGSAHGFIRSVASRYAPEGIRANVVAPGLVRTPMSQRAADDPDATAYAEAKQPLSGGFLPPDSVAAVAGFLLTDDARHVTGQAIEVDGGWGVTEPG